MASLDFLDKEPTELSHEEWSLLPSCAPTRRPNASPTTLPFRTFRLRSGLRQERSDDLRNRLHLGVPTVHTKPVRGRGACTGSAREGTYEGTISYESRDSLNQTKLAYVKKDGNFVVAQFRTLPQTVVGIFKGEVSSAVAVGLSLKGAFSFA